MDDSYLLPYLTFIKEHQKIYRIYLENQREFHHKDRFDSLIEHVFKPPLLRQRRNQSRRHSLHVWLLFSRNDSDYHDLAQTELSGVSRDDRLNSSALYPKF